ARSPRWIEWAAPGLCFGSGAAPNRDLQHRDRTARRQPREADMDSDPVPDLSESFPSSLRPGFRAVLGRLPHGAYVRRRSPRDSGFITVGGERLRIPDRLYDPEPDWSWVRSLGSIEQSMVGCLYTRHHDGYVRERALARLVAPDEEWAAPFVIQLLG